MRRLSRNAIQRIKLVLLVGLFAGPLVVAWGMVEWRVGIPDERVAHGRLMPTLPRLEDWPLAMPVATLDPLDWVLAYDCREDCDEMADRWWRLHRALGREAPRLTRLRFGGQSPGLPGEVINQWHPRPAWTRDESLWLIDPEGRVVLGYTSHHGAEEVLEDLQHLLRMNPEPERIAME